MCVCVWRVYRGSEEKKRSTGTQRRRRPGKLWCACTRIGRSRRSGENEEKGCLCLSLSLFFKVGRIDFTV